jgi:hypothetical protein
MMEKLAQAGVGGGVHGTARPPSFTISTIEYKAVVYAAAERADTLPLYLFYTLYPYIYSVVVSDKAEGYSRWLAQDGVPLAVTQQGACDFERDGRSIPPAPADETTCSAVWGCSAASVW